VLDAGCRRLLNIIHRSGESEQKQPPAAARISNLEKAIVPDMLSAPPSPRIPSVR
jgi:hypothetical protein